MKLSVQAVYDWYRQTIRNPKYRWWIILGTLGYLVMPIDLAPDFLPIVGQLDDVILVTMLATELSQMAIEWFKKKGAVTSTEGDQVASVSDESVDVRAIPLD